ncbi:RNA polymerase sigma factor [Sphaerisporangium dianthi]|uniref:RNA polymerase sigma factor n=1 Tax=Sphaerisporangium dianthi TaxID=1436120 RepID=A0ABV9CKG4_9ACTN
MTDDAQRFTTMYDECRRRVWAYVVGQAGRQVADEVVSETFAIAWRKFDDVPEPALPWLLVVARNVMRDNIRAEIRRESLAAEMRAWTEEDPAEQVAERLTVLAAMTSLADEDRELLILVAWDGLSPRDAAKVVGCSHATFRVRLHRARKRLVQAMKTAPAAHRPARVRNLSEEWS